jgi:TonB-linked SusC/RagA family outer membrane protein
LQLNGQTFVEIAPVKGLTLRSSLAANAFDYRSHSHMSPKWPTSSGPRGTGSTSESFQRSYEWTWTNTAEYQFSIAEKNNFSVLLGQEAIYSNGELMAIAMKGLTNDRFMTINQGTELSGLPSYSKAEYAFNSVFGRIEYNYDNRYFFDGLVRNDASSRFGANKRNATFWALGAMWKLSNEAFLKDSQTITDLSVKVSYGTQGNAGIGNYASLGLVGSTTYGDASGLVISTTPNQELGWETQKLFTVGINAGFWKDRLTVDFEFYNRKTVDMLMDVPYPATSGYSSGYKNVGGMLNRGIDLTVRGDIVRTKDWLVSAYANFNYNKNQITELFNGYQEYAMPDYGLCYQVGRDAGEFYMETRLRVDPADGQYVWLMIDPVTGERGETKNFSQATAELQGVSRYAPMTGGFGLNAQWKGLSVAADFSWVKDKYLINNDRIYTLMDAYSSYNRDKALLNRWEKPGDIAEWGAFGTNDAYFDTSLLENASFLRLKNLTVGYELPRKWMAATGFLQGVRFYFTARNLLTFTKYTGFDPEVDSNLSQPGNNYPNSRQYVGGIQLTF